MKLVRLIVGLVAAISISGCAGLNGFEKINTDVATIINFKQDNASGTQVAQLMCLQRHIAPFTESDRIVTAGSHNIVIRIVDYAYMDPADRRNTKWGGTIKRGNQLMLQANLTAGQAVTIQRRDKGGKSYIWLQDNVTGKTVSEVKNTVLQRQFNIASDILEKECAKGTV
jgi:(p)ppGpp synthase/HD superfamily hydrolase